MTCVEKTIEKILCLKDTHNAIHNILFHVLFLIFELRLYLFYFRMYDFEANHVHVLLMKHFLKVNEKCY